MKIYIAAVLGRQIDGEYVFFKVEKVTADRAVAEQYYRDSLSKESVTIEGITCLAERSIIEAELE